MIIDENGELFGRSMGFPPRLDRNGRVRWSSGPDNIRESIRIILLTEPGERVMLREFGGGLKQFLFMPNIVTTHRRIEDTIKLAIGRWEPRVNLNEVTVDAADNDERSAIVNIQYTLVANQSQEQLQLRLQLASGS